MAKVIFIPIHSFVDVITNSSTELFVSGTNKKIEAVKEILEVAVQLHNKAFNENLTLDDIMEIYYGFAGKEIRLAGFEEYYNPKIKEGIIIRSVSDNTIPYWMFNFITQVFYPTENFHLG